MKYYLQTIVTATIALSFLVLFACAASGAPLVTIDPGHGGKDSGAVSASGLNEKESNLDIGLRVKSLLELAGIRVNMTRSDDAYIGLQERCDLANNAGADAFVSIHNNFSNQNSDSTGTETYYFTGSGLGAQMAGYIQTEVIKKIQGFDRGTKPASFFVLANTKMTAALVECAFLSNQGEVDRLRDPGFRQNVAEGIYNGILKYLQNTVGYTVLNPLPQNLRIHVPKVTSNTRIQVSSYFAGVKWVSQPIISPGDYIIRIDPDGFVRSIDSKLAFTRSGESQSAGVTIYILNPDSRNGADYTSYEWTRNSNYPAGALKWASGGYVGFDTMSASNVSSSSTDNSISLTGTRETLFREDMMLRVHLESVTPYSYLFIPFYWKNVAYLSQKPLPAGDYWIQLGPDPNPASNLTNPYILSLDAKIAFRQIKIVHNPDQVLGIYIANPTPGSVGFDVVAFAHDFRLKNTYQTMLGALPTGPDNGLGYIACLGIGDPNQATTRFATIPTQTLSQGNYVAVTDAGLIRGRIMNARTKGPLPGAKVRIDATILTADANGEFTFSQLTPKTYALEYSAGGYQTQVQSIRVGAGKPTYTPWCYLTN